MTSSVWSFSSRCAGEGSAIRPSCAPWRKCRARTSSLPIACGQTISQPFVVAYMTEQLEVGPENRVLEIGTGSGYQAAVLARLAREVVTIERYRTLADSARERLKALGCDNVTIRLGDGMAGAPDLAPFDRIMVTAAAEEIPDALVAQLAEGGKMVLPV